MFSAKYSIMLISVFTLIVVTNFLPTNAQQLSVTNYSQATGLQSSNIYSVVQDTSDNMWFASRHGILKFDGIDWKTYEISDSSYKREVIYLSLDNKGQLWGLSPNNIQIFKFTNDTWNEAFYLNIKMGNAYYSDFKAHEINGKIYLIVGTFGKGIHIFESGTNDYIDINSESMDRKINSVNVFDKRIYVCSSEGVFVFDFDFKRDLRREEIFTDISFPINIARDKEKNIWLTSKSELIKIDREGSKQILLNSLNLKFFQSYFFTELVVDYFGRVLFSNLESIREYNPRTGKYNFLSVKNGLIADGASDLYVDQENNLWITSYRGISKISSRIFQNYNFRTGLLADEVSSIEQLSSGELVFGHLNGLSIMGNSIEKIEFGNGTEEFRVVKKVLDLEFSDKHNQLWMAASHKGFAYMDMNRSINWVSLSDDYSDFACSVTEYNNRIYLLTASELLYMENNRILNTGIRKVGKFRKVIATGKNLYVATSSIGLLKINPDYSYRQYSSIDSSYSNSIYAVYENENGDVLVGSLGGLLHIDKGELKKYTDGDFEINVPVYFIKEDTSGSLWFGLDNGVIEKEGNKYRKHSHENGLAGIETNRDAGFLAADGSFWIGTESGVSKYMSEFDSVPDVDYKVFLRYMETSEMMREPQQSYEFVAEEDDVTFYFGVNSYKNINSIKYKAHLENYSEDWIDIKDALNPHVSFTNLPPGDYKMVAKAYIPNFGWSKETVLCSINLPAEFHHTIPFKLIIFSSLTVILVLLIITAQKKKYTNRLEEQVKSRTRKLEDSEGRLLKTNKRLQKDIAKRKRTEKALSESEENLNAIFNNVRDGIIHISKSGNVKKVNEAFLEISEIPEKELLGKSVFTLINKFISADQIGYITNQTKKILNSDPLKPFEIHNKGKAIEVRTSIKYSVKGFTVLIRDITAEKLVTNKLENYSIKLEKEVNERTSKLIESENKIRSQLDEIKQKTQELEITNELLSKSNEDLIGLTKELHESEEKFRSMAETIEDVFWLWKPYRILYINRAYENIFELSPEELYSNFRSFTKVIHPADKRRCINEFMNHDYDEKSEFSSEFRIVTKSDKIKWIAVKAFRVAMAPNEFKVVGIASDISLRKKAESEIVNTLNKANELNILKSNFVSMVSHEFRTPLATILSSIEILSEYREKLTPNDVTSHMEKMVESIDYLTDLLDDVILLNRVEGGKIETKLSKFNPNEFLENIVEELKSANGNCPKISIKGSIKKETIETDKKLLRQILSNLISNAIKYTDSDKNVFINVSEGINELKYNIIDEGIGIPVEDQQLLFTPFHRARNAYKTPGTGLGLAIAKGSLDLLNGRMSYISEQDNGTSFEVVIPIT